MGSAKLTKPDWSDVSRTSAHISYAASGFSLPSNVEGSWSITSSTTTSETQKKTSIEYSDLEYSWDFGSSRASGAHDFAISAGVGKSISATVTVTCTKTTINATQSRSRSYTPGKPAVGNPGEEGYEPAQPEEYGEWSDWSGDATKSSESYLVGRVTSNTITVYGQPQAFSWSGNIAANQTIQSSYGLTASDWNILVTRAEQHTNWKNQSGGTSYSNANVTSGELISANKYNIIANALGVSGVTAGVTIITASVFIALQTAVNR